MKTIAILTAACALPLSACATTSFAPPSIDFENETIARGSNSRFSNYCMSSERLKTAGDPMSVIPINPDVQGAQALIDNFLYMYRCTRIRAADGRQWFQVPLFLAVVGTATAVALGAGPDAAIAGGAANAFFGGAGKYYDPKQKAHLLGPAIDALVCIKMESSGIDAFTVNAISGVQEESGEALQQKMMALTPGGASRSEVVIGADRQYYNLVFAALLSVERVVADRLSNVGIFDPAGVAAQIEQLVEEEAEAKEDAEASAPTEAAAIEASKGADQATRQAVDATSQAKIADTIVKLATLQTKLQQCVVRAKMG